MGLQFCLASIYVPAGADETSDVILFLHGFGGSFLFYQHYLASIFPRHFIVCPAYGDSCSRIPGEYIHECIKAASAQIGWKLSRPLLMGISAGGYGGFREYSRNTRVYHGFICIASHPPPGVVSKIPGGARIRLIAGGEEPFVKNGELARVERRIKMRVVDYSSQTIPGEDHFFLLSSEEITTGSLLGWEAELRDAGP